jgi:hypothetical protein
MIPPTQTGTRPLDRVSGASIEDRPLLWRWLSQLPAWARETRRSRTAVGAFLGLAVALTTFGAVAWTGPDWADGKPWKASSSAAECHPERRMCGSEATTAFFMTKEEDQPWYVVDLGAPKRVHRVDVTNRLDAQQAAAVPLVVETSLDGQTFEPRAVHERAFTRLHFRFPGAGFEARYVRLRVDRRSVLHLEAVQVRLGVATASVIRLAAGPASRRLVPWLVPVVVGVAVSRQVLGWTPLWGALSPVARAFFVVSALAFVASLVVDTSASGASPQDEAAPGTSGDGGARGRWRVTWAPSLALLPWCLPPGWASPTQLMVSVAAAVALADWTRDPAASARARLANAETGTPSVGVRAAGFDRWATAVSAHSFAFGVAATLLALAWDRHGHYDNDPGYYAGVARHIVTTGRWEEPIVWHFQSLPNDAVHAPFDHWQPMTSLVLLPSLKLFGTSDRVVYVTMAAISGASIVALAHLISWAHPLRSRALVLAGVAAFALSPFLVQYRLDTETTPVVHLLLLVSLVAIARGRGAWAMIPAWCLPLTRLDVGLWAPLLTVAALVHPSRADSARGARPDEHEDRASRLRRERVTVLAAALACAVGVATVWRASYDTFLPPAGLRAARLPDYGSLYAYVDGLPLLSPAHLDNRWTVAAFSNAAKQGLGAWLDHPLLGIQPVWLAAALFLGALPRSIVARFATAVVASVAFVVPWSSFHMYASWRVALVSLVALVLGALFGLDHTLDAPRGTWLRPAALHARALLATALVWGQWSGAHPPLPARSADEDAFQRLAPALAGHVVLTANPFAAVAAQSAPVVMLPWNGDTAVSGVIRRFAITRWVIGIGGCGGATAAVCREVLAGRRELPMGVRLGAVEGAAGAGGGVRVFAVSVDP